MQPSLADFRPKYLNDLVRVGRDLDGGYVINERALLASRYLISLGIGGDWSFEVDFLRRKPDIKILCFDDSVSQGVFFGRVRDAANEVLSLRFLLSLVSMRIRAVRRGLSDLKHAAGVYFGFRSFCGGRNVRFFRSRVWSERSPQSITLGDVFGMIPQGELLKNSVFIKVDIERSEFRVLPDLAVFAEYVSGMAVEFHDLDILWPNFMGLMSEIGNHFEITHIHGCNYSQPIPGSTTPNSLEVTFLKRSLIRSGEGTSEEVHYPIPGLDYPNDPDEEDCPLRFGPGGSA